jgi:hypothetical protein
VAVNKYADGEFCLTESLTFPKSLEKKRRRNKIQMGLNHGHASGRCTARRRGERELFETPISTASSTISNPPDLNLKGSWKSNKEMGSIITGLPDLEKGRVGWSLRP